MANQPRYAIIENGSTFHVTWKCHNNSWLLQSNWAKKIYYALLLKYKNRYQIKIYSYCLMSNHPHLTGFCEDKKLFSDFFRIINSQFAKAYNKQMKRKGQVVMDRFQSPRIQTDADLLKVMFYIDLNPKRARMVSHPKDYSWSSFHYYAYGKEDPLISPAPSYLCLGKSSSERQKVYLAMVEEILKNDWKEKKPYSSVTFIGNPDWVRKKTDQLQLIKLQRHQRWKQRYQKKFKILNSS